MVETITVASEASREDLTTKADFARLKAEFARLKAEFARLEAKFDAAVNKMLLNQVAVYGLLFAALKLF